MVGGEWKVNGRVLVGGVSVSAGPAVAKRIQKFVQIEKIMTMPKVT